MSSFTLKDPLPRAIINSFRAGIAFFLLSNEAENQFRKPVHKYGRVEAGLRVVEQKVDALVDTEITFQACGGTRFIKKIPLYEYKPNVGQEI